MMSPPRPLPFDPLAAAFSVGQESYRAGLLQLINGRRLLAGRPPIPWPTVGGTPHDVIWQEGAARLLRYRGEAPFDPARLPLLLCCSLINRPYVLDLIPERSVVRNLLGAGFDVWLLDWGHPLPEDAGRSLGGYALERLPRAAATLLGATGHDRLHLLGYCMGGTFALIAAAAGRLPLATLVALATPVDFDDQGLLSTWCRTPGFAPDELAQLYGNLPPHLLQPAFKMLDPVGLGTKLFHLERKLDDDDFLRFFLAMETWLEDSVAFPGRAFAEWTRAYRTNALLRGELVLGDEAIDLRRIEVPILNVVAEADYITPKSSSLALRGATASRAYEEITMAGGHIGLSTGGAAHRTLWPRVALWMREQEAGQRAQADLMRSQQTMAQSHKSVTRSHNSVKRSHQSVTPARPATPKGRPQAPPPAPAKRPATRRTRKP